MSSQATLITGIYNIIKNFEKQNDQTMMKLKFNKSNFIFKIILASSEHHVNGIGMEIVS